jgi:hypothetical protein
MLKNISNLLTLILIVFMAHTAAAQSKQVSDPQHIHVQVKQGNGNNTVAICHQLGNGNSITIYVAPAAVSAHLAHGDYLGTCVSTPGGSDDDDNDDSDDDDDNDDSDDDDDNDDSDDDDNDDSDDDNDDSDDDDDNDDSDDDDDDVTVVDTTTTDTVITNPSPAGCYAVQYFNYFPGTTNDLLTPIEAARLDATKALGMPESSDVATSSANYNFVALGFGGQITLKFANPIHNGDGDDIYVVETTFGNNAENCARYPEKIRAFASQDNCNWVYLGEGCQNTYFDLQSLGWAQYIKLVDISDITYPFGGLADGYDLDGILCLHGEEANPVPAALSNEFAASVVSFNQGTMKNGAAVPSVRSNATNALGAPQNTDVVNFVSLGFGGQIVLGFDYVVFDKAGDDLQMVETSYGNPSCTNYPETARLEISLDGNVWSAVDGEFCLDQMVDVSSAGLPYFQYLRITDASHLSSSRFPGTADGYDVDGVVVLQPGCAAPTPEARYAAQDNINTANEVAEITLAPNPFHNELMLTLNTSNVEENFSIEIYNTLGQRVSSEMVNVASNSSLKHNVNVNGFERGAYIISVRSENSNQSLRAVKF